MRIKRASGFLLGEGWRQEPADASRRGHLLGNGERAAGAGEARGGGQGHPAGGGGAQGGAGRLGLYCGPLSC